MMGFAGAEVAIMKKVGLGTFVRGMSPDEVYA
jgi:hypothetical protein